MAEDNAKRAMADAARLAEELRHEQEHAGQIERLRRALESQASFTVNNNMFAQINLGRGPRRGAVAPVHRKVPTGYNGAPQIRPPKVLLPVDRSPNPTTCLIAEPVRPMMSNGIRI